MQQTRSGEDAFTVFYNATAPAIRAYILRHCSDRASADDLLQVTYVKFLGSRMAGTPQAPQARAYLYRIASNVIADHGRALQRRHKLERRERDFASAAPAARFADDIALRDALGTLSKREQQLLWLLYGEGFAHKEVARIMSLSKASVRVLAFRARKKIEKHLAQPSPMEAEVCQ